MSKCVTIGAIASLLGAIASLPLADAPARADWRTPIAGAPPILPAQFEPRTPAGDDGPGVSFEPPPAPTSTPASAANPAAADDETEGAMPPQWVAPLVDRRLSAAERSADIAPELIDAILRIEPIYDPTRLYGTALPVRTSVSAGTATMDNVFADHWRRGDLDPNVNRRVAYIAMAWDRPDASHQPLPCDAFSKSRARGYNQPALTALSRADCAVLARNEAQAADVRFAPVVAGLIAVPTFAAPLPGARMSSDAFWAARRAEIARAEEDLKLRRVWHGGKEGVARSFARR